VRWLKRALAQAKRIATVLLLRAICLDVQAGKSRKQDIFVNSANTFYIKQVNSKSEFPSSSGIQNGVSETGGRNTSSFVQEHLLESMVWT